MQIYIDSAEFGIINLEVESNSSIDYVKSVIQEMVGIAPNDQVLTFAGQVLDEGRTLGDYDIQKESTITLTRATTTTSSTTTTSTTTSTTTTSTTTTTAPPETVFVTLPSGATLPFVFVGTDTIQQFRQRIAESQSIPVGDLVLTFDGQTLQDGRTLADYGLQNGSTIGITSAAVATTTVATSTPGSTTTLPGTTVPSTPLPSTVAPSTTTPSVTTSTVVLVPSPSSDLPETGAASGSIVALSIVAVTLGAGCRRIARRRPTPR